MFQPFARQRSNAICLAALGGILLGCNMASPREQSQSTPSSSSPAQSPLNLSPKLNLSPNPSSCSVPVIASAITTQEIQFRERQIEIAKEHEKAAERKNQAGIGTRLDVLDAERVRLNCEILLLQAKQLLED